jgi:hypothetical protein
VHCSIFYLALQQKIHSADTIVVAPSHRHDRIADRAALHRLAGGGDVGQPRSSSRPAASKMRRNPGRCGARSMPPVS